jgi:hypothetical protein
VTELYIYELHFSSLHRARPYHHQSGRDSNGVLFDRLPPRHGRGSGGNAATYGQQSAAAIAVGSTGDRGADELRSNFAGSLPVRIVPVKRDQPPRRGIVFLLRTSEDDSDHPGIDLPLPRLRGRD